MAEEQRPYVRPGQPISAREWNRTQDAITRLSKHNLGGGKTGTNIGSGVSDHVHIARLKNVRLTDNLGPDDQVPQNPNDPNDHDTYRPNYNAIEILHDATQNKWVDGDEPFVVFNPSNNTYLQNQSAVIWYNVTEGKWLIFQTLATPVPFLAIITGQLLMHGPGPTWPTSQQAYYSALGYKYNAYSGEPLFLGSRPEVSRDLWWTPIADNGNSITDFTDPASSIGPTRRFSFIEINGWIDYPWFSAPLYFFSLPIYPGYHTVLACPWFNNLYYDTVQPANAGKDVVIRFFLDLHLDTPADPNAPPPMLNGLEIGDSVLVSELSNPAQSESAIVSGLSVGPTGLCTLTFANLAESYVSIRLHWVAKLFLFDGMRNAPYQFAKITQELGTVSGTTPVIGGNALWARLYAATGYADNLQSFGPYNYGIDTDMVNTTGNYRLIVSMDGTKWYPGDVVRVYPLRNSADLVQFGLNLSPLNARFHNPLYAIAHGGYSDPNTVDAGAGFRHGLLQAFPLQ